MVEAGEFELLIGASSRDIRPLFNTFLAGFGTYEPGSPQERMIEAMASEMPLRNVVTFTHGRLLDRDGLAVLLSVLNGKRSLESLAFLKAIG